MALDDFQLLRLLETLVRLAKNKTAPSQVVVVIAGAHRPEALVELAKLADPVAVKALEIKLGAHAAGLWAPPIVAEAASMLRDSRHAVWLSEVGRLAAMTKFS